MSKKVPWAPDHTVQQSTPGLGATNRQLASVISEGRGSPAASTARRTEEWTPSAPTTKS